MKKTAFFSVFIFGLCCVLADDLVSTKQPLGETITLSDGSTLTNAIIKRAEPDGLLIEYDDSLKKYSFEKLSDDVKRKYNYDKDKSQQYKLASTEAQKAYSKQQILNQRAPIAFFHIIQALPNGAIATILGTEQREGNPLSRELCYIEGLTGQFDGNEVRIKCYIDHTNGVYKYTNVGGQDCTIPKVSILAVYK